ncbi:MAG TPA: bifunctional UDP-N-acetylglucosamine diphosphorylase/glucosamine-1-phosphate N-acetyltransferase GlmU [Thermoanaerobaculia bacterium]|nr:bifunctional UDP-N-acetylglucosamine diphosphorylase/glucosamine-1-phosphate N-acetyltransferase GlmU [Thermoanaerobaculia bacterium]
MASLSPIAAPIHAVILAAGKGTRMRSALPKVLHLAAGRPLLAWVIAAARGAGAEHIHIVVGHGATAVRAAFAAEGDLGWIEQREQRGTGHALLQAQDSVAPGARLLVLSADAPLVRAETLRTLVRRAAPPAWGAMAVAELDEPGQLGRVVADGRGKLESIVEFSDAAPEELETRLVNAGIYLLPPEIFIYLRGLRPDNAKGELYLTDALVAAARDGRAIRLLRLPDAEEARGVNDRSELAAVHRALVERKLRALALAGVTVLEPARTLVEPQVEIGPDTVLHPDVALVGETVVGGGCVLHQGAWLRDTRLADGVVIEPYSVLDGAEVGPAARVGPFARLRPGTVLAAEARVGNFVEIKKSRLGRGAKANHLAYLGDAEVGEGANIGAGAITCNYDGVAKHRTEIGAGAFIGSDTMLVAPVVIGEQATTAAGSVITQDVPAGALAVERSRQRTVSGWARRKRDGRGGKKNQEGS